MKILHVIRGLPPTAGTTVFCEAMRDCQQKVGHDVSIATKADYHAFNLRDRDVVHMHAVWSPFNLRVMRDCLAIGKPFVVSTHGCLMPRVFQKGRFKKFLFWHLFLKPLLKKAAAIHCTSEAEKAVCERLGLLGPFVVAPLGVNLPEKKVKVKEKGEQWNVLFLGRLGEEKGLINLLDAWKQLQQEGAIHCSPSPSPSPSTSTSRLIIAGPDWLGYKAKLDAKIAAEDIEGVEFPGLVQGEAKDMLYREADIFVLPSPMENFSMVVLDALAYGVPAIATKGTPWSELESEHCGWWIEQGVEPLKHALRDALSTTTSGLHLLGANGRALAERKYQWSAIAGKLIDCYKKILDHA